MAVTWSESDWSDVRRATAASGAAEGPGEVDNRLATLTGFRRKTATATRIDLEWDPVPGASTVLYQGYTLQYKLATGSGNWMNVPNSATSGSTGRAVSGKVQGRVAGLSSGTTILVRGRANHPTDPTRNGEWTAPLTVSTTGVVGPTVTLINRTSNTLRVVCTAFPGATSHKFRWRRSTQDNYSESPDITASNRQYTITNLTPSTRFLVSAKGNNGNYGEEVAFTTAAVFSPPSIQRGPAPSGFVHTRSGPKSLSYRWVPVPGALGYNIKYWKTGSDESTAQFHYQAQPGGIAAGVFRGAGILGPQTATISRLDSAQEYRARIQSVYRLEAQNSLFSSIVKATTGGARSATALPNLTASVTINEPNLTAVFRFPGHASVDVGATTTIQWRIKRNGVEVRRSELVNSTGPTAAGQAFTTTLSLNNIKPPSYPYGDYELQWSYTIDTATGPSGAQDWSYTRSAPAGQIFNGTLTSGSPGNANELGFRDGMYGDISPDGGPIKSLYFTSFGSFGGGRAGFLNIAIDGDWTSVQVGSLTYLRRNGGNRQSYKGGIPRENRTATVIVR